MLCVRHPASPHVPGSLSELWILQIWSQSVVIHAVPADKSAPFVASTPRLHQDASFLKVFLTLALQKRETMERAFPWKPLEGMF